MKLKLIVLFYNFLKTPVVWRLTTFKPLSQAICFKLEGMSLLFQSFIKLNPLLLNLGLVTILFFLQLFD